MHMKVQKVAGPRTVPVRFLIEDPASFGLDPDKTDVEVKAAVGQNILEVALENGIAIEHTCGGVCACSTCHVYVHQGGDLLAEASDDEEDILDKAFDVQITSRLGCQAKIEQDGDLVVEITRESLDAYYNEHPQEADPRKQSA
jgi:ferredoxin